MKIKYMYFRSGSQHSCPSTCWGQVRVKKRNTGEWNQETAATFLFNCNRSLRCHVWVSLFFEQWTEFLFNKKSLPKWKDGRAGWVTASEPKLQVQHWNVRVKVFTFKHLKYLIYSGLFSFPTQNTMNAIWLLDVFPLNWVATRIWLISYQRQCLVFSKLLLSVTERLESFPITLWQWCIALMSLTLIPSDNWPTSFFTLHLLPSDTWCFVLNSATMAMVTVLDLCQAFISYSLLDDHWLKFHWQFPERNCSNSIATF